jgi:hypothetical protein
VRCRRASDKKPWSPPCSELQRTCWTSALPPRRASRVTIDTDEDRFRHDCWKGFEILNEQGCVTRDPLQLGARGETFAVDALMLMPKYLA